MLEGYREVCRSRAACTTAAPGPPAVAGSGRSRPSDQGRRSRGDRIAQRVEVVAALEERDGSPARAEFAHSGGKVREVPGSQAQAGQRVGPVRVEPGRDEHPVRGEALGERRDHGVERGQVDVAGRAGGEREVDGRAEARAGADVVEAAGAGIQRPFVH